jgi:hypothetical protein
MIIHAILASDAPAKWSDGETVVGVVVVAAIVIVLFAWSLSSGKKK